MRLSLAAHSKLAKTPIKIHPPSPLSKLPTSVLLRSLLVSTVSSKRFLLSPSLSILSFLSKARKGSFLDVDRNPILFGVLKKTFFNQFCVGVSKAQAQADVQALKDLGFRGVIITYARETTFDHKSGTIHGQGVPDTANSANEAKGNQFDPEVEAWRTGTLETIDLVGEGDMLALKMSGAGARVIEDFSTGQTPSRQFLDAVEEICNECKKRSIRVVVDAESQNFQKGIAQVTLDLMRTFNRDGIAVVYNTYQAYLKKTPERLAEHLAAASKEGFTLGLKLVRGAYMLSDDRSLIHDTKQNTDNAYNGIAQGALKRSIGEFGATPGRPFPSLNLLLASHNRESVLTANKLHQQRRAAGLPTVPVSFAQLHGMSDEVSFTLLQEKDESGAKPEVYKCTTWGSLSECMGYLVRRAKENQDAVLRTLDEYVALKTEARRRARQIFSF
ncbi:proline dehydrogenase [Camillea tinctor]|nr:proline dehydrogenase [Camillea tinctor]